MDESVLAHIRYKIEIAKSDELKHTTYCDELPDAIIEQLESEGYSFQKFNMCWIIRWNERKGKTSGKMSIEMILEFLGELCKRSMNILT